MNRLQHLSLAFATCLALLACGGTSPRTQITIYVERDTADATFASSIASVRVDFFAPGATVPTVSRDTSNLNWPLTYAVTPDMLDEFIVEVTAFDAGGQQISHAVSRSTFAEGQTKLIYLLLEASDCSTPELVACQPGTLCTASGCATVATIDPATLPDAPEPGVVPDAPTCAGVTCPANASCSAASGAPVCACNPTAFGDPETGCIDACEAATAPDCGINGTCVAGDSGDAECSCDFPFTGAICDTCGPGFIDDGSGGCEAECLSTGCSGAFEFCDVNLAEPACVCPLGYALVGADCSWMGGGVNGGGIIDREFEDESQWTLQEFDIDTDNGGSLTGNGFGICGASQATTTIDMPTRDQSEDLVLVIEASRPGFDPMLSPCFTEPNLRVGDTLQHIEYTGFNVARGARVCLPRNAYGRATALTLVANPFFPNNFSFGNVNCDAGDCAPAQIDSMRIVRANPGECLPEGVVINGDFSNTDGWNVVGSFNGAAGTAEISGGQLRLEVTRVCQSMRASQSLRFPSADTLANPALRFVSTSTSGENLDLNISSGGFDGLDRILVQAIGTGSQQTTTYCIPAWLQGAQYEVEFEVRGNGGFCALDYPAAHTIDDFEFVSDPGCASPPAVQNGGFEDGDANMSIALEAPGRSNSFPDGPRYETSGIAQSGANALEVNGLGRSSVVAELLVQIPEDASGVAGPMLRFSYRTLLSTTGAGVTISPTSVDSGTFVAATSAYVEHTVCLLPALAGQVVPLRFGFDMGSNPNGSHYVDDVEVVLDASCP